MLSSRLITGFRKEKRIRNKAVDIVAEQVKKLLRDSDQKLILMVRG